MKRVQTYSVTFESKEDRHGYEIVIANSLEEALEKFRREFTKVEITEISKNSSGAIS